MLSHLTYLIAQQAALNLCVICSTRFLQVSVLPKRGAVFWNLGTTNVQATTHTAVQCNSPDSCL